MKAIILYESKAGCTKKCAEYISKNNDVKSMKISEFKTDLSEYDNIVLMTPTYMGTFHKKVKSFIQNNKDILLTKNVTFVVIGTSEENRDETLSRNIDEDFIKHVDVVYAGGAYYLDKINFFYRFIIKKVANVTENQELIKYDNLDKIKI